MKEAYRLFHGRGRGVHYNIDFIPPYILIDSFEDLDEKLLNSICVDLPENEGIFYRNRKQRTPFIALSGEVPKGHLLIEDSLKYEVSFEGNQNIGFFMDMKPGRELIASLCKGKRVLNLFAYTCSFSVSAMKHGASSVTNVDMKKSFLKVGQKNHQLNALEKNVQYLGYDIMKSLSGLTKKGPWDIIIVDPPSNQKSFNLEKDYPKILKRISSWLTPDGMVLACLNSPFLSSEFLVQNAPEFKAQKTIYGAFEEEEPEKGLKMILFNRAD